jgi:hypothetical protein
LHNYDNQKNRFAQPSTAQVDLQFRPGIRFVDRLMMISRERRWFEIDWFGAASHFPEASS